MLLLSSPIYLRGEDAPSKRAVLTAALGLFVERGLGGTTIRDIARESGFSNPVLFKWFEGRDALVRSLFVRCYQPMVGALTEVVRGPGLYRTRIDRAARLLLGLMDRELVTFLFVHENMRLLWPKVRGELEGQTLASRMGELFDGLRQERGGSAPDPRLLASAFLGTLGQVARSLHSGEMGGPASVQADDLHRLFLDMARPR